MRGEPNSVVQNKTMTYSGLVYVCVRASSSICVRQCAVIVAVVVVQLPYLYSVLIITHLLVPLNTLAHTHTHTPRMNDWLTD